MAVPLNNQPSSLFGLGDRPLHLLVHRPDGESISLVASEKFLVSDAFEKETAVEQWVSG